MAINDSQLDSDSPVVPDLYDLRLRRRNLTQGLVKKKELKTYLSSLEDLKDRCEEVEYNELVKEVIAEGEELRAQEEAASASAGESYGADSFSSTDQSDGNANNIRKSFVLPPVIPAIDTPVSSFTTPVSLSHPDIVSNPSDEQEKPAELTGSAAVLGADSNPESFSAQTESTQVENAQVENTQVESAQALEEDSAKLQNEDEISTKTEEEGEEKSESKPAPSFFERILTPPKDDSGSSSGF